jgi:DNA polymerase-1
MRIIDTSAMPDELSPNEADWIYNGLDCCITAKIKSTLMDKLTPQSSIIYDRAKSLQVVLMEMQLRGLRVDMARRQELLDIAEKRQLRLKDQFASLLVDGVGLSQTINPNSPKQVKELLYDVLQLPVVKERNTAGFMAPSSSRAALEQLSQHFYAEPICNHLLGIRDVSKQLGFLRTSLGEDNRMRCSFNPAGTKTGRLNSSFSDYGDGTNLQNVTPFLRQVFIPDPGMCFVNIDLEQADSRNVGAICWEVFAESHGEAYAGSYLDACESGDLHTLVASMAYPTLVHNRRTADVISYRGLTYRDLSKKLGHGTNYYGQPPTMSKHAKIPVNDIVTFQEGYFGAFPVIPDWHKWTINELQTKGYLTNLFDRRRTFFGRLDDQSVINSAIAYSPQGMTGEEMNIGMINLWQDKRFQLLVQVHDSILFQCRWEEVNELVPIALKALETHKILTKGRDFFVPLEAMTGYNWGYANDDPKRGPLNPHGLKKYKGNETRRPPRVRSLSKSKTLLDFIK